MKHTRRESLLYGLSAPFAAALVDLYPCPQATAVSRGSFSDNPRLFVMIRNALPAMAEMSCDMVQHSIIPCIANVLPNFWS